MRWAIRVGRAPRIRGKRRKDEAQPLAHGTLSNQQWRVLGAVNAYSGRFCYLQNYIVGKQQLMAFYAELNRRYCHMRRLYVIQDNWNIHSDAQVLAALRTMPRLQPVWLPTYASWLNPIEKVWRWLRQQVLHQHRLADDWPTLKQRVAQFFDQFQNGSTPLLRYIGLLGEGRWASILHPHYRA